MQTRVDESWEARVCIRFFSTLGGCPPDPNPTDILPLWMQWESASKREWHLQLLSSFKQGLIQYRCKTLLISIAWTRLRCTLRSFFRALINNSGYWTLTRLPCVNNSFPLYSCNKAVTTLLTTCSVTTLLTTCSVTTSLTTCRYQQGTYCFCL
jgi:hypothetical protein